MRGRQWLAGNHVDFPSLKLKLDELGVLFEGPGWQLAWPEVTLIDSPIDSRSLSAFSMLRLPIVCFSTALMVDRESPLMRASAFCVSPISVLRTRTALPISCSVDMKRFAHNSRRCAIYSTRSHE
jgi:hypothetical protein